jgi:hypothetical protein
MTINQTFWVFLDACHSASPFHTRDQTIIIYCQKTGMVAAEFMFLDYHSLSSFARGLKVDRIM